MTTECDRCLQTGAFVRAQTFDYISKAFIVEHNGKKRLVFNLKHLNDFCVKRVCRFGSLSALRRTLRENDLMWSIDLSDAYHHVGVYEPHQRYFTFAIETTRGVEHFSTGALNFGWCRSLQIFTEFMKTIVAYLRNPGPNQPAARVLPWLDDFMFSFRGSLAETILVEVLSTHDIALRAQYIRSTDNWDADYHSRIVRPHEYSIALEVFEQLSATWGACSVDAFASEATALLPRFWAEAAGSAAEAVDAFAQPWASETLVWAHPPPALLPQLVQLLESTPSASAIVCVPYWPGSQWFRPLAELSSEMLLLLPLAFLR